MKFRIGFDPADRPALHRAVDRILDGGVWSDGPFEREVEEAWSEAEGLHAVLFASWAAAAAAAIDYYRLGWATRVFLPANTFLATWLAFRRAGCETTLVDCRRDDLCMSADALEAAIAAEGEPDAICVVHIGGHISFDIERIAAIAARHEAVLLEDCAHAHGARWRGRSPGSWGAAGLYSLYATKTIAAGEGGVLVTRDADLAAFARDWRDYGKPGGYRIDGTNGRASEFTAAVALLATRALPRLVAWKNEYAERVLDPLYPATRLRLPAGMVSGRYKYIVLEGGLEPSSGRVYAEPIHRLLARRPDRAEAGPAGVSWGPLPNTDWVAANHSCPPLYYRGDEEGVL